MKILNRLPIASERTSIRFGDRYVTVRPDQILVWVGIHLTGILRPEANLPRIPASLDSANNFDFSLEYRQLREWAGIAPASLQLLGTAKINEQPVERREAKVWLFPNIPGTRNVAIDRPPFPLEMRRGIAVSLPDDDASNFRFPLLGLPSILKNDLDWWLDPQRRHITVQTRTWRRWFMRLLCRV